MSTNVHESKKRWVILGVLYICILAFAIMLQSVPPVLSLVIAEFELSYAQGGLLMSFFLLPGIVVSIPAGILADRYNQKAIVIISLFLMIAGAAIFASGSSFSILILGRILSGVGAVILTIVLPQLLAQWFIGHEIGRAMGIFHTGVPLGAILSLSLLSLLAQNLDWRASIWLSAALSLVALTLFAWLFVPAPQRSLPISLPSESIYQSIKQSGISIWLVGAAWALFNATGTAFFTFTPELLTTVGFSIASAGFITGIVMWPSLVLSPAIGLIMDKIGHKRAIIAIGGITIAMLVFWVPTATSWILALTLLLGMAQALIPAPIYTLIPDVTSPERLGLAFGIISICLSLGAVAGSATAGWFRDITGSYQTSYGLASGFALLITVTMLLVKPRPAS